MTMVFLIIKVLKVFVGDGRGGFRSQDTSQSSPHNCGFYFCGDQSGDGGRCVFRYQKTMHYYFFNCGENVDGDERGGYMSHTRYYPSHNIDGNGRFLGCSISYCPVDKSVHGDERGINRSQTIQLLSHNHGGQSSTPTGPDNMLFLGEGE